MKRFQKNSVKKEKKQLLQEPAAAGAEAGPMKSHQPPHTHCHWLYGMSVTEGGTRFHQMQEYDTIFIW